VNATLLPPAKLQYGRGVVLEPGLSGSWNSGRNEFAKPAVPVYAASKGFEKGKF
jgi:hypothetical protein